jgi:DNA-binding NtrC family response regulator
MADILVIDDDDDLRDTLRAILERGGYTVQEARHGQEGLAWCQAHAMALVITDLLMPEQEGMETIRQLRALDPAPTIIAMSGGGLFEGLDLLHIATVLGAARTLQKPIRARELRMAVQDLLAEP